MSRRSRSDAYMRIWIKFSDSKESEQQLVLLEQKIRGVITDHGYQVYALEFQVKDDRAIPSTQDSQSQT